MQEISVSVEQKNGVIGFNFEEIKANLEAEMQIYRGMVFTEDSKKEAKKTVAELRSLKKSVEDKRKEVKASFMTPYTEFESKVKELNQLIDEPINFINAQIEAFEQKRLEERRQLIRQLYEEKIDGMEEYIPLEKIYNPKWENATTTKKAIIDDLEAYVINVKNDLETIRSMGSVYEDKGIEEYMRSLLLARAIQCINNYEKQAAEIKARQDEENARKALAEQQKAESVPETPTQEAPKEFTGSVIVPAEKSPAKANTVTYEIEADKFQIAQLEAAMRDFGITYRRV